MEKMKTMSHPTGQKWLPWCLIGGLFLIEHLSAGFPLECPVHRHGAHAPWLSFPHVAVLGSFLSQHYNFL